MAVTVDSVIDRVQTVLQDTTGVRWPVDAELVLWINDAQREIALLKPDASACTYKVELDVGTRQNIPADGNRLLKVVRNVTSANEGRRAIRLVGGEVLDSQSPDWHDPNVGGDASHGSEVKHYVYNESSPRTFYVYPGVSGAAATAGVFIELIYSSNPTTVESGAGNHLSLPDIYANAVMNYVLYMCYMKDAEFAGNSQRGANHYQLFTASITGKGQIDTLTNPNADAAAVAPI